MQTISGLGDTGHHGAEGYAQEPQPLVGGELVRFSSSATP